MKEGICNDACWRLGYWVWYAMLKSRNIFLCVDGMKRLLGRDWRGWSMGMEVGIFNFD